MAGNTSSGRRKSSGGCGKDDDSFQARVVVGLYDRHAVGTEDSRYLPLPP